MFRAELSVEGNYLFGLMDETLGYQTAINQKTNGWCIWSKNQIITIKELMESFLDGSEFCLTISSLGGKNYIIDFEDDIFVFKPEVSILYYYTDKWNSKLIPTPKIKFNKEQISEIVKKIENIL